MLESFKALNGTIVTIGTKNVFENTSIDYLKMSKSWLKTYRHIFMCPSYINRTKTTEHISYILINKCSYLLHNSLA